MNAGFRIRVERIGHSFREGGGEVDVLRDVSFTVDPGRVLAVLGVNGSGKSTIMGIVAGILRPRTGSAKLESAEAAEFRKPIVAYLHQDYRQSHFPWSSVVDNVAYPLEFQGVPRKARREVAARMLERFLPEVDTRRPVRDLSGGQQQLVAIARALAAKPDAILGDEPLSAADAVRGVRAIATVRAAIQEHPVPVIWVSHDVDEALLLGDDIGLLSKRVGSFGAILTNPVPPPRVPADLARSDLVSLKAEIFEFLLRESEDSGRTSLGASRG